MAYDPTPAWAQQYKGPAGMGTLAGLAAQSNPMIAGGMQAASWAGPALAGMNFGSDSGYLSGLRTGSGGSDPTEYAPFLPFGAPPVFGGDDFDPSKYAPDRTALDFMTQYGTQPLGEKSPWMEMQEQMGQRELSRQLGDIRGQTGSAYQQQIGNLAAQGGIDPATAARISQTTNRAGMAASQEARGGYQDFLGKAGIADLEQRLGMAKGSAMLEPEYTKSQMAPERLRYESQFNQWQAMQNAAQNAEIANALAGGGSDPMFGGMSDFSKWGLPQIGSGQEWWNRG